MLVLRTIGDGIGDGARERLRSRWAVIIRDGATLFEQEKTVN
ncbi:hypothetical protein [Microvirga tunisiensis]|nr:hypothetical protein [Microvirga tunisiensis]